MQSPSLARPVGLLLAARARRARAGGARRAGDVNLRVEGRARTLFEGHVDATPTLRRAPPPVRRDQRRRALDAGADETTSLDAARSPTAHLGGHWFNGLPGLRARPIGRDAPRRVVFLWGYALNHKPPPVGVCPKPVQPGADVLFALRPLLDRPTSSARRAPALRDTARRVTVAVPTGARHAGRRRDGGRQRHRRRRARRR